MTPKEKAEEIVDRFTSFTDEEIYCALVCVDEIIKALPSTLRFDADLPPKEVNKKKMYFERVKEEIKKL